MLLSMEDTVLRAAKPKASLEQDPNLLTFRSTAIARAEDPDIPMPRGAPDATAGNFWKEALTDVAVASQRPPTGRLGKAMHIRWVDPLCR